MFLSYNPPSSIDKSKEDEVWAFPFSLAATKRITFVLLSSAY